MSKPEEKVNLLKGSLHTLKWCAKDDRKSFGLHACRTEDMWSESETGMIVQWKGKGHSPVGGSLS